MLEKIANFVGNWARSLKFVLFVSFCFTLGTPQWVYREVRVIQQTEDPVTWYSQAKTQDERRAIEKKVRAFHQNLKREADSIIQVNGWYGPYDYFDHLDKGRCFDEQSGLRGGMFTSYNHLQDLVRTSMREGPYDYDDIELAKMQNLERYPEMDPSRPEPEINWRGIGKWFGLHYLYALPLALIWFLINLVKFSKEGEYSSEAYKFTLRSPLSFFVATLLYPGYFFWRIQTVLTRDGKRIYTEAEIRMHKKKFLTLLSEDEKQLVNDLVHKRANISEIRESVRQVVGPIQYRGIFTSIIATCVVMIFTSLLPRTAQGFSEEDVEIECQIDQDSYSYESVIGFGYDTYDDISPGVLPLLITIPYTITVTLWAPLFVERLLQRPPDAIFHVPIYVVTFDDLFKKIQQKIRKHEKNILHFGIMPAVRLVCTDNKVLS